MTPTTVKETFRLPLLTHDEGMYLNIQKSSETLHKLPNGFTQACMDEEKILSQIYLYIDKIFIYITFWWLVFEFGMSHYLCTIFHKCLRE